MALSSWMTAPWPRAGRTYPVRYPGAMDLEKDETRVTPPVRSKALQAGGRGPSKVMSP